VSDVRCDEFEQLMLETGDADEQLDAALRQHMGACAPCARKWRAYAGVSRTLGGLPTLAVHDGFADAVMALVAREPAAAPAPGAGAGVRARWLRLPFWMPLARPLAAAAMLCLCAVVGLHLMHRVGPGRARTSESARMAASAPAMMAERATDERAPAPRAGAPEGAANYAHGADEAAPASEESEASAAPEASAAEEKAAGPADLAEAAGAGYDGGGLRGGEGLGLAAKAAPGEMGDHAFADAPAPRTEGPYDTMALGAPARPLPTPSAPGAAPARPHAGAAPAAMGGGGSSRAGQTSAAASRTGRGAADARLATGTSTGDDAESVADAASAELLMGGAGMTTGFDPDEIERRRTQQRIDENPYRNSTRPERWSDPSQTTFSFDFQNTSLPLALSSVGKQGGLTIEVRGRLDGTVTANMTNVRPEEALRRIASRAQLSVTQTGARSYVVAPGESDAP
jgi:negative regulator of sigma E activity